jgi:hypothetical protein
MKIGICKLCLQEKQLITKSHIIPEFMYGPLFDEGHKLNSISYNLKTIQDYFVSHPSSGIYEKHILCSSCENEILNHRYEDYASKVIFAKELPESISPKCQNFPTKGGLDLTECLNVDYTRLRLFYLSILWKTSISSQKMFAGIKLPESDEEKLRTMILNNDSGNPKDFQMIFYSWLNDKSIPNDSILMPSTIEFDNGDMYMFVFNGIIINIFKSFEAVPGFFRESVFSKERLIVWHIPKGKGLDFIRTLMSQR